MPTYDLRAPTPRNRPSTLRNSSNAQTPEATKYHNPIHELGHLATHAEKKTNSSPRQLFHNYARWNDHMGLLDSATRHKVELVTGLGSEMASERCAERQVA